MKALEKAAKDRVEARTEAPVAEPAPEAAPAGRSELTLEPLAAATPEPPGGAAPPLRGEPPVRPATAQRAAPAQATSGREQARAVIQAGSGAARGPGVFAYASHHPIMTIAVIAAVIALGFGTYVYLQLFHPGLFYHQSPIAPASPVARAPAPAPVAAPAPPPAANGAPPVASGELPPSAPPVQQAAAEPPAPPAPPPPPAVQAAAREKPAPSEAAPTAPSEPALRTTIVVNRGTSAPTVSPVLSDAYSAFQANRLEDAQRAYEQLLRAEPRNIDALLGTAAIAAIEGRSDDAVRRYLRVLELEPRNSLAQSALIGMMGRADPAAAEAKLKQLIAREPSPFLYFTLGNLYADQSHWTLAQQAYFQAYHLEPANADYAYNLAVGLEHVNQGKLALGFYRRAVQLAGAPGHARFNLAQAEERISRLASQVE